MVLETFAAIVVLSLSISYRHRYQATPPAHYPNARS